MKLKACVRRAKMHGKFVIIPDDVLYVETLTNITQQGMDEYAEKVARRAEVEREVVVLTFTLS